MDLAKIQASEQFTWYYFGGLALVLLVLLWRRHAGTSRIAFGGMCRASRKGCESGCLTNLDDRVHRVFAERSESRWFTIKRFNYGRLYASGRYGTRIQDLSNPDRENLDLLYAIELESKEGIADLLAGAKYRILKPQGFAWLKFGCATKCDAAHPETLVLGLERWLLRKGWLTSSAADHELVHCMQQLHSSALDREASGALYSGESSLMELQALCLGSPLWIACTVVVFGAPLWLDLLLYLRS